MVFTTKVDRIHSDMVDVEIYDSSFDHPLIKIDDENGKNVIYVAYVCLSKHEPRVRFNLKTKVDTKEATEALYSYVAEHKSIFIEMARKAV